MSQPPTSRPGPDTPGGSAPVAPPRKKRPAWLIPLIAAVVVALLLLLLLSRCGSGDDDTTAGTGTGVDGAPSTSATTPGSGETDATEGAGEPEAPSSDPAATAPAPSTATTTPATPEATATPGSTGTAGGGAGDTTLVTADGTAVLPLATNTGTAGAGLASVEGQDVQATGAPVESVPADEGFWLGTAEERVWAELTGDGESDFTVQSGQRLTFSARVVPHDDGYAAGVGVDTAEGADQLDAQGQHLLVDRATLTLSR